MPVDVLWTTIGFVVGVAATAFAFEVAIRRVRNDERASLTKDWDLVEFASDEPPGIVTTSLEDVNVPHGSRVLVAPGAKLPSSMEQDCEIRIHEEAKGNFVVGSGRAIFCTGPVKAGTLALETVHPSLVSRLDRSFQSLWVQGQPYKKQVEPGEIARNEGAHVEVTGRVTEVLSSGEKALLDIETPDGTSGQGRVSVPARLPIEEGTTYRFDGNVVEEGGRRVLKAEEVEEKPRQAATV
jgi:hypothetical protein